MLDDFIFYVNTEFSAEFYCNNQAIAPYLFTTTKDSATTRRSVTILTESQLTTQKNNVEGFLLRLTITNTIGIDPKLFVYVAKPALPGEQEQFAEFQRVASPDDLAMIPAEQPAVGANPPYLRLDFVELIFYSRIEALEVRDAIIADIDELLQAMDAAEKLIQESPIIISHG